MEKKKNLKGRKELRIYENLTWRERKIRWKMAKIAREKIEIEKKRVWIKGGRIRIEGQWWRWDEEKKKLEKEGRGMGERLEVFRGKEDEGRKGKREKEGEEKEEGWKGM